MATIQAVGLLVSPAVFVASARALLRADAHRIRALPGEWRDHPELRDVYSDALQRSLGQTLRSMRASTAAAWFASLVIGFAALAIDRLALSVQLLYVAFLAASATAAEAGANAERVRTVVERHGLTRPPRTTRRRARIAQVWVLHFLMGASFFATAVFAGGLIALPLT